MLRKTIFRRKTVTIHDEDQISRDNHDSKSLSSTDSFNTYHGNIGAVKKSILKRRFKTSHDSLPGDVISDTETASQFSSHTNKSGNKFKKIITKICDKLKKTPYVMDSSGTLDATYFDELSESEFAKDKFQLHDQNTSNTINANNAVGSNENIVVANIIKTPEINLDLDIPIQNMDSNKNFNNTGDIQVIDEVDYAYERSSDYETRSSGMSCRNSSPDGLTIQGKDEMYSYAKLDCPQVVYKADTEIFSSRLQDTPRDDKTFDLNFGNERELTELDFKTFDVVQTIGHKNSEHLEYSASLQTCVSVYDKPNVFEICLEESFVDKLESVYNETENTMAILDAKKTEDSKIDDTVEFNVLYSEPNDENHTIPLVSKDSLIIDEAPEKDIDEYSPSPENIDFVTAKNSEEKDKECIIHQTNDRADMVNTKNQCCDAGKHLVNGGIVSPGLSDIYEYSDNSCRRRNDSSSLESSKSLSITEPVMNACLSPKFEVMYSDYKSPVILNRALLNEPSTSEESEIDRHNKILQSSLNVVETEFVKNLNDTLSATTEIADVQKSAPPKNLMRVPFADSMGIYEAKPEKLTCFDMEKNIDICKVSSNETCESDVFTTGGNSMVQKDGLKTMEGKTNEDDQMDTNMSENKNLKHHLNGDKCKVVELTREYFNECTENVLTKNEQPIEVEDFVQLETTYVLKDNTYTIQTLDTDMAKEDLNNEFSYASEKFSENNQEKSLIAFDIDSNLKETNITNERFMHVILEEENESSDDQLDIATSDKLDDHNLVYSNGQNQGPKPKKTKEQGDMSVTQKSTNEIQESNEEHLFVETDIISSAEQHDKVCIGEKTNPIVKENPVNVNKKQDITVTKTKKETSQLNVLMTGDQKNVKENSNEGKQEKENDKKTILDDEFSTSSDSSIKSNQENIINDHKQLNGTKAGIKGPYEKHEENSQVVKGLPNDTSKMNKLDIPCDHENEKDLVKREDITHEQQKSKAGKKYLVNDKNNRMPDNPKLKDRIAYSYDETFTDFDAKHTESLTCSPLHFDAKSRLKNKLSVDILQFHKRLQKSTKKSRNKRASIKGLIERRKPSSRLTNTSTNLKSNTIDQNITDTASVSLTPPCQSLLQFYKAEMERAAAIHTYVHCFSGSSNVEYRLRMRRSYRSPYQLIRK